MELVCDLSGVLRQHNIAHNDTRTVKLNSKMNKNNSNQQQQQQQKTTMTTTEKRQYQPANKRTNNWATLSI